MMDRHFFTEQSNPCGITTTGQWGLVGPVENVSSLKIFSRKDLTKISFLTTCNKMKTDCKPFFNPRRPRIKIRKNGKK